MSLLNRRRNHLRTFLTASSATPQTRPWSTTTTVTMTEQSFASTYCYFPPTSNHQQEQQKQQQKHNLWPLYSLNYTRYIMYPSMYLCVVILLRRDLNIIPLLLQVLFSLSRSMKSLPYCIVTWATTVDCDKK